MRNGFRLPTVGVPVGMLLAFPKDFASKRDTPKRSRIVFGLDHSDTQKVRKFFFSLARKRVVERVSSSDPFRDCGLSSCLFFLGECFFFFLGGGGRSNEAECEYALFSFWGLSSRACWAAKAGMVVLFGGGVDQLKQNAKI